MEQEQAPPKRDIVSEIDYSDAKSAIEKINHFRKKRTASQTPSALTNKNLAKFDQHSRKSKFLC